MIYSTIYIYIYIYSCIYIYIHIYTHLFRVYLGDCWDLGIFGDFLGFFGNLAAGFVADKALKWLSNNKEAVIGFFQFLQDHDHEQINLIFPLLF